MSVEWITVLTFATVALVAGVTCSSVYDILFRYRLEVSTRLAGLKDHNKASDSSVFKQREQRRDVKQQSLAARAQTYLEQSGVRASLQRLAWLSLGLGAALGIVAGAATGRWWAAIPATLAGLGIPAFYVYWKRTKRHQQLLAQLPQAFEAIGRAVRAGQSVPAAMQIVADEFDAPLADEFSHCYQQQNLGMARDSALRDLAKRNQVMELQILVVALLLQSRSGGNLVELLESLATMVRNRIKFQQRLRALTGEGRMQALILTLLPIVSFAGLLVIAPDYAVTLLHHPWLIAVMIVSQIIGAIWIRWCVNFEV